MIAIQAAGAMTPVGLDLTDTMVGLYTRVQLFEDLGVLDGEGEPLSGMKIRFDGELSGPERIAVMAHAVVDECAAAIEPVSQAVPLVLCCPDAAAFGPEVAGFPERLLADVMAKSAIPIDGKRSRVIARGRDGTLEALDAALALLKDPSVPCCLLGGVDSLIDDQRAQAMLDDQRLVTPTNKDGFVAGEAGVMLVLTNRPDKEALATWLSAAAGNEEACRGSDHPITGAGLQDAMTKALALAKVPFEAVACLAPDFSGEVRYFEELVLANTRLAKVSADRAVEIPAFSVGESGAAAGFLAIAMLAFLHSKGVHAKPSLAVLSCDGPARGAVVLGPANGEGR